jgi:hypothetical protein
MGKFCEGGACPAGRRLSDRMLVWSTVNPNRVIEIPLDIWDHAIATIKEASRIPAQLLPEDLLDEAEIAELVKRVKDNDEEFVARPA